MTLRRLGINVHSFHLLPLAVAGVIVAAVTGCAIEPPLKLADGTPVDIRMPEIVTEFNLVWDIDYDWEAQWWYRWDEVDETLFGPLRYPDPTNFEARIYYYGASHDAGSWLSRESQTVYGYSFSRRFMFGVYDMMLWSNIDSPDGTQVLRINEDDPDNIWATTSRATLGYTPPAWTQRPVHNNPEPFFSGSVRDFLVSKNPEDYDYFDADRQVYVKKLDAMLYPMVYTYLVQVIVYNNKGRIIGTADHSAVTSMADGVSLHTGHTSLNDVTVTYDMRFKRDMTGPGGRPADIFGGKLTTFGLCDIEPRSRSRIARYTGSRSDLHNNVVLNLRFANQADSVYLYDVTQQMQRQIHGGLITIEIDADTITVPSRQTGGAGTFDPVIQPADSVVHEFDM